jgi:membrane protein YqaA with SNARE-associated domain
MLIMDWQSWGLLVSAYTSATLLPGSSELALGALLVQAPQQWVWWLAVATVGNVLGSMTSWGMGYWLACYRPLRQFGESAQHKALGWLQRYGYWSLLLAWLPVVGDPLCLLAGWLRWSFWISFVLILMGKTVRYLLIVMTMGLLF